MVVGGLHEASETQTNAFNRHFAQYADYENTPFTALNTAFAQHGLFVYVPRNTVVEAPLHVVNLARADDDLFYQPRNLIVVEAGAQFRIVEQYGSLTGTPTFANAVAEYYAGAGAHVQGFKVQNEGPEASRIDTVHAYQGEGSTFSMHTTTLSGTLVRNNLNMLPDAEYCETHMYGLFLADGTMHVDNHTLVDHARPNCFSNELYKGILDDRATGVFNGKVLVRPDAQKTNAYQSNKSIVLSETAHMYAKPELEIYADDVKCSHGATTGQVEPEALFYLRSRGLSERQARKLLLLAFARDVLDAVPLEPLREHLDALVAARLDT
jgi:Fe-S cluster assembly protein SufD